MGTASVWTVVVHPAAFIEHLPTVCCQGRCLGLGDKTSHYPFPPEAHRAHPKLYLMEFNSGNGPFTSPSFLFPLRTELCFGPSFSFRSPESHKPRTVSVYRSSTYRTVFCVIFLPHPTTATMCSHCCQHINILHSPETAF